MEGAQEGSNVPPPRPTTTTERKRGRPPATACRRCKTDHRKCSGERPCARCVSLGLQANCTLQTDPLPVPSESSKKRRKKQQASPPHTQHSVPSGFPASVQFFGPYPPNAPNSLYAQTQPQTRVSEDYLLRLAAKLLVQKEENNEAIESGVLASILEEIKSLNQLTLKLKDENNQLRHQLLLEQQKSASRNAQPASTTRQSSSRAFSIDDIKSMIHRRRFHKEKEWFGTLKQGMSPHPTNNSVNLHTYDFINSVNVRFVIDDAEKPFAIIKVDTLTCGNMIFSIVGTNHALSKLTKYSLSELLGDTRRSLMPRQNEQPYHECTNLTAPYFFDGPTLGVSHIFSAKVTYLTKHGRPLLTEVRKQVFYTDQGTANFFVICVDEAYEMEPLAIEAVGYGVCTNLKKIPPETLGTVTHVETRRDEVWEGDCGSSSPLSHEYLLEEEEEEANGVAVHEVGGAGEEEMMMFNRMMMTTMEGGQATTPSHIPQTAFPVFPGGAGEDESSSWGEVRSPLASAYWTGTPTLTPTTQPYAPPIIIQQPQQPQQSHQPQGNYINEDMSWILNSQFSN